MAARLPSRLFATATSSFKSLSPAFTCAQCHWLSVVQARSQSRHFSSQPTLRSQEMSITTPRKFTYHSAAAFSGKHKRLDPATNVFHFNPYNHIHPQKKRPKAKRPASGQDAFFISRLGGSSNSVAFGIADGVGGWEDSGVDPADFSHNFCDYMASAAYEYRPSADVSPLTPRTLMQKGYDDVCDDKSIPAGGSTACVAIASDDGLMEVANLGDSGFVHLRLNAVHNYSDPQTHAFNTPYQLSVIPPSMLARAAAFGGAQLCDYPKDADVTSHTLKHGDIVILASDGVWDNLFNQDILRIASRLMTGLGAWKASAGGIQVADSLAPFTTPENSAESSPKSLTLQSALALEILGAAKSASTNQRLDGPFAKEVQKYYPHEDWHGGKIDDICIIVMVVSEDGATTSASKAKL